MPIVAMPDGAHVSFPDEMPPDQIRSLILKKFPDAGKQAKPDQEPADHGLSERQKLSPIEKAISPITSYPATYQRMNQEARDQMSQGVNQISNAESLTDPQAHGISDVLTGAGQAALGA